MRAVELMLLYYSKTQSTQIINRDSFIPILSDENNIVIVISPLWKIAGAKTRTYLDNKNTCNYSKSNNKKQHPQATSNNTLLHKNSKVRSFSV